MNNPVNEIDENGYIIWWVAAAIIAAVVTTGVAVGVSIGVQLATTGKINGWQVFFDAIMGALSGLLMITGFGPLEMALWNGAFGFVGSAVSQWIGKGSFFEINWFQAIFTAGLSIVASGAKGGNRNKLRVEEMLFGRPQVVNARELVPAYVSLDNYEKILTSNINKGISLNIFFDLSSFVVINSMFLGFGVTLYK